MNILSRKLHELEKNVLPELPEKGTTKITWENGDIELIEPNTNYIDERLTWLEPKIVCEVIYQVLTRDCKLRMPRLHTLRYDKNPAECTIDQIEGKGKCFPK